MTTALVATVATQPTEMNNSIQAENVNDLRVVRHCNCVSTVTICRGVCAYAGTLMFVRIYVAPRRQGPMCQPKCGKKERIGRIQLKHANK